MKTAPLIRPPRRGRLITGAIATGAALALLLAGCSSTTGSGPGAEKTLSGGSSDITAANADPAQLAATIKKAFYTDLPVSTLSPVVANTLAVASKPLSTANQALLKKCLSQPTCDTGRGTLKVGIPILVTANPYTNVNRAEATAQLLAYPEVREIDYSNSNGDIATSIANIKALIARHVDAIIVDLAGGGSLDSVLQQAKSAGIILIAVNTPPPASTKALLTADFPTGLCQTYTNGVKALTATITKPSTYILYTGIPGNDNAGTWQPCAKKAFDAAGWKQLPSGFTNWNAQGESQAANALRSSGKVPGAIVYDASPEKLVQPFLTAGQTPPAVVTGVPFLTYFSLFDQQEKAGKPLQSWISNGHVWFSRLAVTAAIEIKQGKKVPAEETINLPMAPAADVLKNQTGWETIPQGSVAGSLLTPDQIKLALAAN